jgi:hypothetical protein
MNPNFRQQGAISLIQILKKHLAAFDFLVKMNLLPNVVHNTHKHQKVNLVTTGYTNLRL